MTMQQEPTNINIRAGEFHDGPNPDHFKSFAMLFPLPSRAGYVFSLCRIEGEAVTNKQIAMELREHLERLANSFGAKASVQHRFEQFLSALNQQLANHVREGDWVIPIANFHALLGIVLGTKMFLSGTGDLTTIFLHREPTQQYQVFNLFRGIQTEQALPTWEKAFTVVLDGELSLGDVLCAGSRELQRFVPADELHSILASLPPKSAAEKIRQYFPHNSELAMLIIQATGASAKEGRRAHPVPNASLEQLGKARRGTERALNDQQPYFLATMANLMRRLFRRTRSPHQTTGSVKSRARLLGKLLLSMIVVAAAMLYGSTRFLVHLVKKLLSHERVELWQGAVDTFNHWRGRLTGHYQSLPPRSRSGILAALCIVVALALAVVVLSRAEARSAEREAYAAAVSVIEKTRDQANSAAIYKNESKAKTLYEHALKLSEALPTDSEERQVKAATLQTEISGALDTLRRIVNINEPPLISDLSKINLELKGLTMVGDNTGLYLFASDQAIYRLDPVRKTVSVAVAATASGLPLSASLENGQIYWLDDRQDIWHFDPADNYLEETNVVALAQERRWLDMASYARKLYLLEPTGDGSGQIIRYKRAGSGFDAGAPWIKAKTSNLNDAVSFAIDASIFVLKRDGSVVRFVNGGEVSWPMATVDPALTAPTSIWTNADSQFVYIWEPASARLVVFNKETSAIVVQYHLPSLASSSLADFTVDEAHRSIYFLTDSKIYGITASHIK